MDWRLYRKKKLLFHEGSQWILQNLKGRTLKSLTSRRKSYATFWQFPDSPLRDALQGPLDIRALIELATEDLLSVELQILNNDKKIVCILEIQQSNSCHNDKQLLTVHQREVRGYTKKFKQVASCIRDVGGIEQNGPVDTFHHLLEGSGRTPLDYRSAYNVPLDPLMSSREALRCIYSSLLADIHVNTQGILDDTDTEFLHDLRVAVRRTRSGLALIKNVLSPEVSRRFKKEFRDIGQMTGPVRDLDVYLLSEEAYKARLPVYLQEGLGYFFEDIAAKRKEEQRRLTHALRRPHFIKVLTEWGQALESNDTYPAGKNVGISIATLAGKIVHKRFQMVLDDGRKIQPGTPDCELHRLRIECKKLRYSLEFFISLYDQQRVQQFIRQLKKLQNNLGDFNDLSVQQDMLANYLTHVRPGSRKSMRLAASIGGLMSDLSRQHQELRTHFEETFARFSCSDNLSLYNEIFGK